VTDSLNICCNVILWSDLFLSVLNQDFGAEVALPLVIMRVVHLIMHYAMPWPSVCLSQVGILPKQINLI